MLSAYSHMMGLYPLGTGLQTTNDVSETKIPPFTSVASSFEGTDALEGGYRAIPVNVLATGTDFMFMRAFDTVCKKAKLFVTQESNKRAQSQERMDLIAPVANGIVAAGYDSMKYFKEPQWTSKTAGIFADVDKCYYYHEGKHMGTAPDKTVDDIADQLEWAFGVYYIDDNYPNEDITKLFTTRMAEYVIQKMEDKVNPGSGKGPSSLKYAGLSGHESNVIPFMLQYGLTSLDCIIDNLRKKTKPPVVGCETSPKFAANFMWELS